MYRLKYFDAEVARGTQYSSARTFNLHMGMDAN